MSEQNLIFPEDVRDQFKRPVSRWHWVCLANGDRVNEVAIEHSGGVITRLSFKGDHSPADVVAAVADAVRRRRERRKEASKRAAETRRRRRESGDFQIAKAIIEGTFRPSGSCACCRRQLTDAESITRGVGPECWDGLLQMIARILGGEQ